MGIIKNAVNEKSPDLVACEKVEDTFLNDAANVIYEEVAKIIADKIKKKTMPKVGYFCLTRQFYRMKNSSYDEVLDEDGEPLTFSWFLTIYSDEENGKDYEYYLPLSENILVNCETETVNLGFLKKGLKCTVSYPQIVMDILKRIIKLLKSEEGLECYPLINYTPKAYEKIHADYLENSFLIEEYDENFVENLGKITIPFTKNLDDIDFEFGPAIKICYK